MMMLFYRTRKFSLKFHSFTLLTSLLYDDDDDDDDVCKCSTKNRIQGSHIQEMYPKTTSLAH